MNSTFLPERTLSMEDSMYLELMPELPRQLLLWGYGPLGEQLSTFTDYRSALPVSYTHLRAHETVLDLVCRLLLEKKNNTNTVIYQHPLDKN